MSPVPEVAFEMTDDDWFRVLHYQMQTSRMLDDVIQRSRRTSILTGVVVGAGIMGWGYSKMRDRPVAAVISAILHGVVYAIVWAVYYFACFSRGAHTRRWKRMIRRSLASGTLARPRGEYRIALHPEFALAGYGGTSSTFAWATTKSVNATGDEVFVEFADQVVLRIPFRAFETQTERLLFLGQLEELARAQGVQCPRLA